MTAGWCGFGRQPSLERLKLKRTERLGLEDHGRQLIEIITTRIDNIDLRAIGANAKLLHLPDRYPIREILPRGFASTVDFSLDPNLPPIAGTDALRERVDQRRKPVGITVNHPGTLREIPSRLLVGHSQPLAHQLRRWIHPRG